MKIRGITVGTPLSPEASLIKANALTDEEKAQARANIGAAAVGEGGGGETVTDEHINALIDAKLAELETVPTYDNEVEVV